MLANFLGQGRFSIIITAEKKIYIFPLKPIVGSKPNGGKNKIIV